MMNDELGDELNQGITKAGLYIRLLKSLNRDLINQMLITI